MTDERTREYYRRRAPEYEQIYYRDLPARRKEIDDEAAFLRTLAADRDVLDVACGTGYWTQIVADTAATVVAVDLSREMLAEARRKRYRQEPSFVQGDVEHLPVGNCRFDLLVLGFWFSHQPKERYREFFEQIKRPVRRDGLIWMIDNNPPAEGATVHSIRVDEHGNNFKERFLDNGEPYVILKNYFSRAELESVFAPEFVIERLIHKPYYWSILLRCK